MLQIGGPDQHVVNIFYAAGCLAPASRELKFKSGGDRELLAHEIQAYPRIYYSNDDEIVEPVW